jgi:hypothetical protein
MEDRHLELRRRYAVRPDQELGGAGGDDTAIDCRWRNWRAATITCRRRKPQYDRSACLVTAIKKDFEVLSSNNASQAQKLASLKFLGHWVGDIHQPLHVSFEDDRGGNNVLVTGECGPNLHSAWDTCLVLKAVGEDVGAAATELLKTITPAKIESWNHSNPMDWANESFAIAEQARTEYCIRQGASCNHPSGKVKIDAAYVAANAPIVREQLQKSAVRLAHLLDAALGK